MNGVQNGAIKIVNNSFFFFQAEDGIRDIGVTGVQTCALPICSQVSLDPKLSFYEEIHHYYPFSSNLDTTFRKNSDRKSVV